MPACTLYNVSPRKLLHKRVGDKGETQEENFLPKYQRVKDLCQRAEFQTACEQLGQVRGSGGAQGVLPGSFADQGLFLGPLGFGVLFIFWGLA